MHPFFFYGKPCFHAPAGVVYVLHRFQPNLLTNSVSWLLIQKLKNYCIILRNLRHLWVSVWFVFLYIF